MKRFYEGRDYNGMLSVGLEKQITAIVTNDKIYFDNEVDLDKAVDLMKKFVREHEKVPAHNYVGKVIPLPVMR
jgi:hypothetical protein